MKIGIEHTAIFSKDTKKITDWYKDMFGCEIVYDNGKGTYFIAFSDKSMIEFCSAETETVPTELSAPGVRHIALSVSPGEFDELADKIKASGAEIITDAAVNAKGVGTMFFRDIDGNILHLISRKTPLV